MPGRLPMSRVGYRCPGGCRRRAVPHAGRLPMPGSAAYARPIADAGLTAYARSVADPGPEEVSQGGRRQCRLPVDRRHPRACQEDVEGRPPAPPARAGR